MPGALFTAAGYLAALAVIWLGARRRGTDTLGTAWVVVAGMVGGVFGARLAHWLFVAPAALADPAALIAPRAGGRTLLGGILVGWVAVEATKRRLGLRRSTGDLFAPALLVGEAVGRLGCLLNGCCYGRPSLVPWAIHQHGAWRHPTQVYLIAVDLLVLAVLGRWPARREGDRFRAYLMLYGTGRFLVEFCRDGALVAGLTLGQWSALALAGCGAALLAHGGAAREEENRERGYAGLSAVR